MRFEEQDPAAKVIFEGDLAAEYKRLKDRHRLDWTKVLFEREGSFTLREFKKLFKYEMEENPERYTLELPDDDEFGPSPEKLRKARDDAMA